MEIDEIITAQKLSTLDRAKDEEIILAIQDTTDLDFTNHPNTAGLGHLDAEQKTVENFRSGQRIITVADREADIFDLFSQVAAGDGEFLIRASHNRCVESELSYLIPTIEAQTIAGYTTVQIGRNPVNAAREARLSIQFMTTKIHSPAGRKLSIAAPPVTVNVILATEVNPPEGVEPIRWLLLTTLACHHLGQGQPPPEPPTLGEAVLMLAQLGGFLARRGDGVPGVKTIWRGFSRLTDLVTMWRLLHQPPHPT